MQAWTLRALSLLAAAVLVACGGAAAPPGVPVRVEISHLAHGAPLVVGGDTGIATAAGDSFTVSKLRYYLSNFRLRRPDGSWFTAAQDPNSSAGYQLVDAAKPQSGQFEMTGVPPGSYTGIEFLIGVDEARNHAGAQTGALDPLHGLFWTWKTGYIFFQLEGHSPQSASPGQTLTFHIGGGAAATRTVFLPLAPKPARVEARVRPVIHLHADVGQLFDQPHTVRFATLSSAMSAEASAPVADNAAAMFRVDHLHHEPVTGAP